MGEAAAKLKTSTPRVQRSHNGPPTSAMLEDIRKGLRTGSGFANKREEHKKTLRGYRNSEADSLPSADSSTASSFQNSGSNSRKGSRKGSGGPSRTGSPMMPRKG